MREAVTVDASNVYGMIVPSLLMTMNLSEVEFHAARCEFDGTRYERFVMPGRVWPSVIRTMGEPNVGSLNWKPAPPSDGSAGFVRVMRSVIAEYCDGTPVTGGGGGLFVVNDHTGP